MRLIGATSGAATIGANAIHPELGPDVAPFGRRRRHGTFVIDAASDTGADIGVATVAVMAATRRTVSLVGTIIVVLTACGGGADDTAADTAAVTPAVTAPEPSAAFDDIDGEALAGVAFDVRRDPG